uniref:Uncharacterized protein n=1 Tax=Paracidobacterium acidisoli TaxID=2303751 RepID=A0A372IMA0_9BACT
MLHLFFGESKYVTELVLNAVQLIGTKFPGTRNPDTQGKNRACWPAVLFFGHGGRAPLKLVTTAGMLGDL